MMTRVERRSVAIGIALLALAGCADTTDEKGLGGVGYKVGKPYQIAGVWYYPKVDYEYDETGFASWYGEPFDGRRTANGEVFDKDEISAAHKTLPMPSIVRVSNLENGRDLVVRINDRGPFVDGRIIDLSERAAEELGFRGNGLAKVRVKIMAEESLSLASAGQTKALSSSERAEAAPVTSVVSESLPPPPSGAATTPSAPVVRTQQAVPQATPPRASPAISLATQKPLESNDSGRPTRMYIQAGSFLYYDNANALAARLNTMGPTLIARTQHNGQSFYRVLLGPLSDTGTADRLLTRVVTAGQHDARIVVN